MDRTNLLEVREAVAGLILGMGPPAYPEHQDATWNRVRSVEDIKSGGLRNFLVRPMPDEENRDGLYGDGYERASVVQIWTSYIGLEDDADGAMISDDARQIWYHLEHEGTDPQTPGIRAWVPIGWVYENEAPGKAWGHHDLLCIFLASDEDATT